MFDAQRETLMRQLDTNTEEIESTLQELDMHEDSEDQNYQLLVITIWLPIIIWEWTALQGGEFSWGSIFLRYCLFRNIADRPYSISRNWTLTLCISRICAFKVPLLYVGGGSAAHLIHASLGLWVYTPNGTLIGSAICAGLISVANRQTDHRPCHFICSRRQCSLIIHTYTQALIQPVLIVNSS